MRVKPSSLLCPARTEKVGLGACVPTKSVCFYPCFIWVIHSWLADSQTTKELHGCVIEEVPCFGVGFLESLAPHSLSVTHRRWQRCGKAHPEGPFCFPAFPRSQGLDPGLSGRSGTLGLVCAMLGLFSGDFCAPWAISASSAHVKCRVWEGPRP